MWATTCDEVIYPLVEKSTEWSESKFRSGFNSWLKARAPFDPLPLDDEERTAYLSQWQQKLFQAGYVGASFPTEYGGQGLPSSCEAIILEELGAAGAPSAFHYAYVARVILEFGTAMQRARYLQPALSGSERWCQGFSEPDAGSDLAAVRTIAKRDGEDFIISGQKVWSSRAHWADWCLLLVRTGDLDSRHRGLTVFIVDVKSQGLTIRPFRQMNGALEFAEIFLDDVRVPAANMVGELNGGWQIAMSTVAYERGPADVGLLADLRRQIYELVTHGREAKWAPTSTQSLRLARLVVEADVLQSHVMRGLHDPSLDDPTHASVDKVLVTDLIQSIGRLQIDTFGASVALGERPDIMFDYLYGRSASVYGGTAQIQRNVIAQRVLGLPR
ncbi:MAG: acyl-CoA dehydrogenase family protein [Ilumatobacteraceae bacterium]|jgi:alkylation response protein AidB-like acyl-CoA dehydrogenase|nr:acyl-CoA dehydrogenase family protein [Ilumatobacteraceae bacterium]